MAYRWSWPIDRVLLYTLKTLHVNTHEYTYFFIYLRETMKERRLMKERYSGIGNTLITTQVCMSGLREIPVSVNSHREPTTRLITVREPIRNTPSV